MVEDDRSFPLRDSGGPFACEFILPETGQPCRQPGRVVEIGFAIITDETEDNGLELHYYGHMCEVHEPFMRAHAWEQLA